MNRRVLSLTMMLCTSIGLTGCGVGNISPSGAPKPSSDGSFPTMIQNAMASYKNFTAVPLLAPTVTPQSTGRSKSVTATGKSLVKDLYQVTFYQSNNNDPSKHGPGIAYYTGQPESDATPQLQVLTGTGYGPFKPEKDYEYKVGKATLADGISATTYYLKLMNNNPGLAKGGTQVIWKMNGYHCEVGSTSFSISQDISTANALIRLIKSFPLPKPYTTGTVVLSLTPDSSPTSQQQAVVSWDEKIQGKVGVYKVVTMPPCKNPIDTAIAMASSMKPYLIGSRTHPAQNVTNSPTKDSSSIVTSLPHVSSDAMMKRYTLNSSNTIGKHPKNYSVNKNVTYANVFPNLNVQTPVLNMKRTWGMKFTSGFSIDHNYYYGSIGDSKKGIKLNYEIDWHTQTQVLPIACWVSSDVVGSRVSESQMKSVASRFLGYCSTIPYNHSNPKMAKQWVVDTLESRRTLYPGIDRKIGNVTFTLHEFKLKNNEHRIELDIVPHVK
jgi:hypothetical protein